MEYDPTRQAALFFSGEGKVATNSALSHPTSLWQWQGQAQNGAGDWQALVPGFAGYSLGIQLSGGKVLLSWPTNATGYLLESVSALPGVSWQTVTNPSVVSGTQFLTTNNLAPGQAFYRLHLP